MPVSVDPLTDTEQCCRMVSHAQSFWKTLADDSKFSTAVQMTQNLVFCEAELKGENLKQDKSGIRKVNNNICKPELYPEHEFTNKFFFRSLENNHSIPLNFSHVAIFDNILEVDTTSILKYYTAELLRMNVELIRRDELLSDLQQLIDYGWSINGSGPWWLISGKR